jgi:diphthamide synthase (EF-2-diphthine--ammonia ligase)
VDPCGENGEFHTYVFDGPIFKKPISVTRGEVVKKTYSYQKKNQNDEMEKVVIRFLVSGFTDLDATMPCA